MSARRILVATFALALVPTEVAEAGVLTTPQIVLVGDEGLHCIILNVSEEPRGVTIEVVRQDGRVAADHALILAPHAVDGYRAARPDGARFCRFTVEGEKPCCRAVGCVYRMDVGYTACVPAE